MVTCGSLLIPNSVLELAAELAPALRSTSEASLLPLDLDLEHYSADGGQADRDERDGSLNHGPEDFIADYAEDVVDWETHDGCSVHHFCEEWSVSLGRGDQQLLWHCKCVSRKQPARDNFLEVESLRTKICSGCQYCMMRKYCQRKYPYPWNRQDQDKQI
ncbi:unnamed protein product [Zymoseptoria tritici ST99CH_3D7]|uniref:Uncharacterized protein n=1 Tax=Zymoseptoria tritici (strain ST99CH_3D7) TaxID=1276538 RepID=A0A1X7RYN8_ZYMT9|nr:unnamed protein product [Zymoseptoria tritici ST99CH_3D7]